MSLEKNEEDNISNLSQKKLSESGQISESEIESESENISKLNTSKNVSEKEKNNNNIINNYEILSDFKEQPDLTFKGIMIGDPYVGKSSLLNKSVKKKFDLAYSPTLGFDYYLFYIKINNKILRLQIWDTCGQEIYQSLITNFYRNSSIAFMVYSINDRNSFEHIDNWLKEIKYKSNPDTKIFLIGNKSDLNEDRKVSYEEGEKYSYNYEFSGFYEVSAKTGEKVEEIMVKACQILFEEYKDYQSSKGKNIKKENIVLNKDDKSSLSKNEAFSKSGGKCC